MATQTQPLQKGQKRVIGGVCSGLAEHFNLDVTPVRVVFVVLALMTGAGFLLYLLLWILMPEADVTDVTGTDVIANGLKSVGSDIDRIGEELKKPAVR
ncbi:MAG TPA: PspC domain-containing protein [Candidatus Dormibacteraeota bacterium]|nr:PspC domain-containing protein [Candidatus Dormibacteraeota bacterium]